MNKHVTMLAGTTCVAGGLLLFGAVRAEAAPSPPAVTVRPAPSTPGGGPEKHLANVDADAPVVVCGIGVPLLGDATAACPAAAVPTGGSDDAAPVDNLVTADAQAPITLCGLGLALGGDAVAGCPSTTPLGGAAAAAPIVAGAEGIGINLQALLPIRLCGLALALGRDAQGACPALAPDVGSTTDLTARDPATTTTATTATTTTPMPGAVPTAKATGATGAREVEDPGTAGEARPAAIAPAAALPVALVRLVRRTAKLTLPFDRLHPAPALPPADTDVAALGAEVDVGVDTDAGTATGPGAYGVGGNGADVATGTAGDLAVLPGATAGDDLLPPIVTGLLVLGGGLLSVVYRARVRAL